ncbi:MAG: four helix bundle protein [Phycisphaerae bacterium]|nr:four helix bundle protein [Planctomycetia bacterium]MCK6466158.1 four helix bundle protein [Phycisphaerae bacterium]MCL4719937.1 four helix bundle protein [Phycisphaerae bacterium]NUQ10564.1 four helix bundle protein [Phycisphaerae bacterium]
MGQGIRTFKDLAAWQRAMALCKEVYALTRLFPDTEKFGLTAQIRRAEVSIPSNIAEGYGRRNLQESIRFLNIAHRSLGEVETQVLLAQP